MMTDKKHLTWREALDQEEATYTRLKAEDKVALVEQAKEYADHEDRNFDWSYRLMMAFAKYIHAHAPLMSGHEDCEWSGLVGSSISMYLHQARELAGIDHGEYLAGVRDGTYSVDDLWEEFNEER